MPEQRTSYYELSKHSYLQIIVYLLLVVCCVFFLFSLLLPFFYHFFSDFLQGIVHTKGEPISYVFSEKKGQDLRELSYWFSWAIDFDAKGLNPVRYWFNPCISVIVIVSLFSLGISALINSIMPRKIGLIHQKIEREIARIVKKITETKYGVSSEDDMDDTYNEIKSCHDSEIGDLAKEYKITSDDLKVVKEGIIWQERGLLYKLIHINDGIRVYMRFYFTVKYSNVVLGLVYIGASVLILIIGLRGLKFIPPSQPTYILFSLGLEFSLLLTFAVTTIYSRQDEEPDAEDEKSHTSSSYSFPNEYGSAKEIEKLIKVFIKDDAKNKKVNNKSQNKN